MDIQIANNHIKGAQEKCKLTRQIQIKVRIKLKDAWRKRMWYVQAVEYFLALRRKGILMPVLT